MARLPISEGIFTNRYQDSHHFRQLVARKATMPILFWLPAIFMGAFFELARIACESTERSLALSGGAMLPNDPKEPYVVLDMAGEIVELW